MTPITNSPHETLKPTQTLLGCISTVGLIKANLRPLAKNIVRTNADLVFFGVSDEGVWIPPVSVELSIQSIASLHAELGKILAAHAELERNPYVE